MKRIKIEVGSTAVPFWPFWVIAAIVALAVIGLPPSNDVAYLAGAVTALGAIAAVVALPFWLVADALVSRKRSR